MDYNFFPGSEVDYFLLNNNGEVSFIKIEYTSPKLPIKLLKILLQPSINLTILIAFFIMTLFIQTFNLFVFIGFFVIFSFSFFVSIFFRKIIIRKIFWHWITLPPLFTQLFCLKVELDENTDDRQTLILKKDIIGIFIKIENTKMDANQGICLLTDYKKIYCLKNKLDPDLETEKLTEKLTHQLNWDNQNIIKFPEYILISNSNFNRDFVDSVIKGGNIGYITPVHVNLNTNLKKLTKDIDLRETYLPIIFKEYF